MAALDLVKAHAYGNDFLFAREEAVAPPAAAELARRLCERHRGLGADGLILFRPTAEGAAMRLYNPDGGMAEISGNGLRCLAALVVRDRPPARRRDPVLIETDAGTRRLDFIADEAGRVTFTAAMGAPADLRECDLEAAGTMVRAIVMSMGNPQCVVIEPALSIERLRSVGAALAVQPCFPAGTNVELAHVDSPDRVSILIWERGVGPTEASGTGACAAAVAAIAFAGAHRRVEVVSPGGSQIVEWRDDGVLLTGWAEIVYQAQWLGDPTPAHE